MGLSICVGVLAEIAEFDPESGEHWRAEFGSINEVLAELGLPQHSEPKTLPPLENRCSLDGFPYSFLHTVRRAYARRVLDPRWIADPMEDSKGAARDSAIKIVAREMSSHLICHSDAEGFYLPLDFAPVLVDEKQSRITGGWLGSSYRLAEELVVVAPALGINLVAGVVSDEEAEKINSAMDDEGPLRVEQIVWLSLYEAARLSIEHRAAICFC